MSGGGPTDELVARLLSAADGLAEGRAARIVAEATEAAEAEVRELVRSAATAALLRRAVAALEGAAEPPPGTAARPPEPRDLPSPMPRQCDPAGSVADAKAPGHEPAPPPTPRPPRRDAEPDPTTPPAAAPHDRACYIYCITRKANETSPDFANARGVDAASAPRLVEHEGLAAVVTDVSPELFSDASAAERLRDLEWVGQKVRAHDQVVRRAMSAGPVIPLRFGTLVRGPDDVVALLARHGTTLRETLGRLDGHREVGVKVWCDTAALARYAGTQIASGSPDADAGRSGKSYLLERTRGDRARAEQRRLVRACAEACHDRLSGAADDAALLPLSRPAAAGAADERDPAAELVLNAAYLVADADAESFESLVADLAVQFETQGFSVELTGPWPPYNFVAGLDLSTPPESARQAAATESGGGA